MIRSEIRTAVVAAVGAALMSAVVACAPGASTADRAAAQCMTENGVAAPPDGAIPPDGATPPPLRGPQADCATWCGGSLPT